ncbi:hypothetical protein BT96DRAFT_1041194 [Gymnopus androsaceus JB14]|uniref:FAR1 domain-containing protein n=1 Tax=Gymnopus androsaceus JB14 TaxID=1447944 RepID=A0A6A4HCW3_9AGAR|nr:hypothetical protein BT96DRAFT_1041194 [Gymnopus androsaceus JB14]
MLSGHFSLQWASKEDFTAWREEEQKKTIEFLENRRIWDGDCFDETVYYVCSRGATGGTAAYTKKNSHWQQKVPAKRTGCKCSLTIKSYLNTKTVVGKYNESHNHEIGNANLRFTCISKEMRELIAGFLRSGVSSNNIPLAQTSSCSHTGHLNVITHNNMIRITPCTQIPLQLALIDCTLEELEADEPDWDMPWRCNSKISPSPSSSPSIPSFSPRTSSPLPSSSAPSSQPSPSSLPASTWPLGLTVAHISAAFSHIFDNESSLLSPQRRFEMEFGEDWNPDVFFLHYNLWKALSKEDLVTLDLICLLGILLLVKTYYHKRLALNDS